MPDIRPRRKSIPLVSELVGNRLPINAIPPLSLRVLYIYIHKYTVYTHTYMYIAWTVYIYIYIFFFFASEMITDPTKRCTVTVIVDRDAARNEIERPSRDFRRRLRGRINLINLLDRARARACALSHSLNAAPHLRLETWAELIELISTIRGDTCTFARCYCEIAARVVIAHIRARKFHFWAASSNFFFSFPRSFVHVPPPDVTHVECGKQNKISE